MCPAVENGLVVMYFLKKLAAEALASAMSPPGWRSFLQPGTVCQQS